MIRTFIEHPSYNIYFKKIDKIHDGINCYFEYKNKK